MKNNQELEAEMEKKGGVNSKFHRAYAIQTYTYWAHQGNHS